MITSDKQILTIKPCTFCGLVFFSTLLPLGIHILKTLQLYNFKTRLGEICSSDENMSKGHYIINIIGDELLLNFDAKFQR